MCRNGGDRRGVAGLLVSQSAENRVAGRLVGSAEIVVDQIADPSGREGDLEVLRRSRGPLEPAADGEGHCAVRGHPRLGADAGEGRQPLERRKRQLPLHLIDSLAGRHAVGFIERGDPRPQVGHQARRPVAAFAIAVASLADGLEDLASCVVSGESLQHRQRESVLPRPAPELDLVENPRRREPGDRAGLFGEIGEVGEVGHHLVEFPLRIVVAIALEE